MVPSQDVSSADSWLDDSCRILRPCIVGPGWRWTDRGASFRELRPLCDKKLSSGEARCFEPDSSVAQAPEAGPGISPLVAPYLANRNCPVCWSAVWILSRRDRVDSS